MTAQIDGLNQAVRNGNDAVSLIQTAEGSLTQVTDMLQRMRTLAVQAASDTNTADDRTALNQEFTLLRTEINRIGNNTQWNGENVLNGSFGGTGEYKFQVGANNDQTIDLTIDNYATSSSLTTSATASFPSSTTTAAASGTAQVNTLTIASTPVLGDVIAVTVGEHSYVHTVGVGTATAAETIIEVAAAIKDGLVANGMGTTSSVNVAIPTTPNGTLIFTATSTVTGSNSFFSGVSTHGLLGGIHSSDITDRVNANSAIGALDVAINTVNAGRAEMGATINVLQYAGDNLTNVSLNASASRSRVEDTDYSSATTELARTQIIAQAATAMLAQANQIPQTVLSLLK